MNLAFHAEQEAPRISDLILRSALLRASRRMAHGTAEQAAILRDGRPRGRPPQDGVSEASWRGACRTGGATAGFGPRRGHFARTRRPMAKPPPPPTTPFPRPANLTRRVAAS